NPSKSHQHNERTNQDSSTPNHGMRALKAIGRGMASTVNWIDSKGPFITALATVAIAVLTGVYVHWSHAQWSVMNRQLCQMMKQTADTEIAANAAKESADINKQTAEGTQAASVGVGIAMDSEWSSDNKTIVIYPTDAISYSNDGKVSAYDLDGTFTLETANSRGQILHRQSLVIHVPVIPINSGEKRQPFFFEGLKQIEPLLSAWKATATFRGRYTYDDGFKRIIPVDVCRQVVPLVIPNSTPPIQGVQWVDCSQVAYERRRFDLVMQTQKH
ncbi:MAG: hypothetical protein ABSD70_12575, partial [Terracidiphilus sp.]